MQAAAFVADLPVLEKKEVRQSKIHLRLRKQGTLIIMISMMLKNTFPIDAVRILILSAARAIEDETDVEIETKWRGY